MKASIDLIQSQYISTKIKWISVHIYDAYEIQVNLFSCGCFMPF